MSLLMRLDSRCQDLLNRLMIANDYIRVFDIAKEKNVSKRSVYYDLCKINDWFDMHKIPRVDIERNKGVFMSHVQKEMIANIIEEHKEDTSYIYSPMERVRIMICVIINSNQPIYIENLMEYCDVSRNTIFNDLKAVSNKLQEYDLALTYELRRGYQIKGDSIRKRAIFFLNFNLLSPLFTSGILKFLNKEEIENYLQLLLDIEKQLKTKYVQGTLLSLAALLPVMIQDALPLELADVDLQEIQLTREYTLVSQAFPSLIKEECCYLCLHLLGSRMQSVPMNLMKDDQDREVYELAKALVSEFKKIACVEFEKPEEIERSLFVHLKTSLYRYRYGIQLGNPLIEDIVKEYPNLFEITKRASEYIAQQIGAPIPDAEIAYLTLHFGGFMRSSQSKVDLLRVLIVCPNGISTGNMLKGEVSSLLPNARILDVVAIADVKNVAQVCDLVISTVKVKSDVPIIIVHPILTDHDRIAILKRSITNASLQMMPKLDSESLFHLVSKYVEGTKHVLLRKDIENYVYESQHNVEIDSKEKQKGIMAFLDKDVVQIWEDEANWQDAIHIAARPLVQKASIQPEYVSNILSQIQYYGPYMFIAPNIVLAHAKSEHGALRLDVSMAVFKKGIAFSQHHEARIILVLSPIDQESHLHILRDIMAIFSIETHVDDILQYEHVDEIIAFMNVLLQQS